jgi:hypothetical protein
LQRDATNRRYYRLIDELEQREKSLVLKLRDLESDPVDTVQMLSPEETQTVRSMAGSSPVARGGAGLGLVTLKPSPSSYNS